MHAPLADAALAALIACGGPGTDEGVDASPHPPPGVGRAPRSLADVLAACRPYEDDADIHSYCIQQLAPVLDDPQEVSEACARAGRWEDACRRSWVEGRGREPGRDRDSLLRVCGRPGDCAFMVLDMLPADDPVEQAHLCVRWAGRYATDCVGHALQRWYIRGPTAEEVQRLAQAVTCCPDRAGFYLGAAVRCLGVGACPETGPVATRCAAEVRRLAEHPELCPPQWRAPLHEGRNGPMDGTRPAPGTPPPGPPGQAAPTAGPTR